MQMIWSQISIDCSPEPFPLQSVTYSERMGASPLNPGAWERLSLSCPHGRRSYGCFEAEPDTTSINPTNPARTNCVTACVSKRVPSGACHRDRHPAWPVCAPRAEAPGSDVSGTRARDGLPCALCAGVVLDGVS